MTHDYFRLQFRHTDDGWYTCTLVCTVPGKGYTMPMGRVLQPVVNASPAMLELFIDLMKAHFAFMFSDVSGGHKIIDFLTLPAGGQVGHG